MSVELILYGIGEGIASSFISGALDIKHAKKGGGELADVAVTTLALTGACVAASYFLSMPPFIPVALSVFVRVGHTARELYLRFKGGNEDGG